MQERPRMACESWRERPRRKEGYAMSATATKYRLVLTFDYANGPVVAAAAPADRATAMKQFEDVLTRGGFTPDSHRRARVMSVEECERAGIR